MEKPGGTPKMSTPSLPYSCPLVLCPSALPTSQGAPLIVHYLLQRQDTPELSHAGHVSKMEAEKREEGVSLGGESTGQGALHTCPSSLQPWQPARPCLVQGRLLHQLEGRLVDAAAVEADRLAQLLLLPGFNLSGRGGPSPMSQRPSLDPN